MSADMNIFIMLTNLIVVGVLSAQLTKFRWLTFKERAVAGTLIALNVVSAGVNAYLAVA